MNSTEYQKLASRTECDQQRSRYRMVHPDHECPTSLMEQSLVKLTNIRLNHSIIGLSGEVGELASLLQKKVYYGKELTEDEWREKFKDELGDVCWYLAQACNVLDLDLGEVMEANIRKLQVRYPEKYEDRLAADENRDRTNEAMAMRKSENFEPRVCLPPRPREDHPNPFGVHEPNTCEHEWFTIDGLGCRCKKCGIIE